MISCHSRLLRHRIPVHGSGAGRVPDHRPEGRHVAYDSRRGVDIVDGTGLLHISGMMMGTRLLGV